MLDPTWQMVGADPTGTGVLEANLANKCASTIVYPGGARERILGGLGTRSRRNDALTHTRGDRLAEQAETMTRHSGDEVLPRCGAGGGRLFTRSRGLWPAL